MTNPETGRQIITPIAVKGAFDAPRNVCHTQFIRCNGGANASDLAVPRRDNRSPALALIAMIRAAWFGRVQSHFWRNILD